MDILRFPVIVGRVGLIYRDGAEYASNADSFQITEGDFNGRAAKISLPPTISDSRSIQVW